MVTSCCYLQFNAGGTKTYNNNNSDNRNDNNNDNNNNNNNRPFLCRLDSALSLCSSSMISLFSRRFSSNSEVSAIDYNNSNNNSNKMNNKKIKNKKQ